MSARPHAFIHRDHLDDPVFLMIVQSCRHLPWGPAKQRTVIPVTRGKRDPARWPSLIWSFTTWLWQQGMMKIKCASVLSVRACDSKNEWLDFRQRTPSVWQNRGYLPFEFIWHDLAPFDLKLKYVEIILFKHYSIVGNVKPINAYLTRHWVFRAGCMNALFLFFSRWSGHVWKYEWIYCFCWFTCSNTVQ